MDLYFQYDENLSNNEFFRKLQSEHKIIIDTAPLENWIVCIPRSETLQHQKENLVDPNFILAHILIPNDELPKTHFTNLLGHDIHMENQKLVTKNGLESIVLFEEVFYTKTFMKYKVWCIECPLYGDRSAITTGIFIVRDLRDAIELIWNETQSKTIFRKIDDACTAFTNQHKKKNEGLDQLQTAMQLLYAHCIQMLMFNKRLKEKCRQDLHFYKILKIALETYVMSNLYDFIFDAICVNTLEDGEQINKKVRNLTQVHLSYFGIDQKCSDFVTSVRAELLKIEDYSTAVEKLACLRRALNATSRHSPKNLCVDELISILVFVIIKSGLTHWFATFRFLKDFILNDLTELSDKGADSFLITTLEAAIFYLKTFNETKRPVDGPVPMVEPRSKFSSKSDFIENLHCHIRAGHEPEVLRLLTSKKDIEIVKGNPSSSALCHPLCDCDNCSAIIEERPNVNTPNCNGITALHVASMNGLPKMVNLLLALDADLKASDENNWTALHYAAARGHQNVLLLLLHAGIEINCQTNDKYTPLHFSCLNGHQGCVKALLYYSDHIKVKIEKNLPNKMGDTPLHLAATWGFVEIIETLLECGVKIDRINRLGLCAQQCAHNSFVTELLQNTFVMVDDDESTSSWANESSIRKVEPFRGYIDENALKADMELHRKTDNDKIIAAIRNGDLKLAYYFLGLDFQENDTHKSCHPLCTCDMCSARDEDKDLNENNCRSNVLVDINGCNAQGVTLLHAASLIGDVNLVQYLLSQGAAVDAKTLKNETVLHFAVRSKSSAVIDLILSRVDEETLNSTDVDGNTALHLVDLTNGIQREKSMHSHLKCTH